MSHRFTYLVYRAVETCCRLLPLTVVWQMGRVLGRAGSLIFPGYRRLVRRNLEIAFGHDRSAAELDWLTREHFATLTANLLSSLKISYMDEAAVLAFAAAGWPGATAPPARTAQESSPRRSWLPSARGSATTPSIRN